MWHQRFGLRSRPFGAAAGGDLFPAALRGGQLRQLEEALAARDGFALLLGAPGLGKTFLLHQLAAKLGDSFHLAWLTHAKLPNLAALHQALLFDWDCPSAGKNEQELRLAAIEQVLKHAQAGQATLLIVDDAHHLQADHLEELRLLANLEAADGKYVVGLLAGQPRLADQLRHATLTSLAQQVVTRVTLEPLGSEESMEFVCGQLLAAGGEPRRLLDEEALELLVQHGQGVPRLLNNLAREAFRQAAAAQGQAVDAEAVLAAADSLGLALEDELDAELPLTLPTPHKRSA